LTPLYLGLDGGGTKTAAAAVDADGRVRGLSRAGPSTFKSLGLPIAADVLAGLAAEAAGKDRVGVLVAGVADVDTAADRDALQAALRSAVLARGLAVERLEVVNDSVIALASGTRGLARGIACIAGTGSVAFGVNRAGREGRAGGWGPPFADGGSAYWIGFQAVGRALKLHDRGQAEAPLVGELLAASGCSTLAELLYDYLGAGGQAGVARDRLPALARAVEAAARAGDADARAIFAAAGLELAELVGVLVGRLGMAGESFDLVTVGGVWGTSAPTFQASFSAELARIAPGARTTGPSVEPAVGAALLARELGARGGSCPAGLLGSV